MLCSVLTDYCETYATELTGTGVRIMSHIQFFVLYVIAIPYSNFNRDLARPLLKLRHQRKIIFRNLTWM